MHRAATYVSPRQTGRSIFIPVNLLLELRIDGLVADGNFHVPRNSQTWSLPESRPFVKKAQQFFSFAYCTLVDNAPVVIQ